MKQRPATWRDLDILARTILGEARGEPEAGQIAVAHVARNRARASKRKPALYGDGTIASACLQPFQFSCWNKNDPNRARIEKASLDDPALQAALLAALSVVLGKKADPTFGSTHYHRRDLAPKWAANKLAAAIIGAHAFYNDIE
jgi:spore germination cell wall hydrolase CwlJ-like protein